MPEAQNFLIPPRKLKKNKLQQKRRSALIDTKDNPKLFWQTIKDNSSLKRKTDNAIQSGDWFDCFKNLLSSTDTEPIGYVEDILRNNIQENNIDNLKLPITEGEIRGSTKDLNSNRSGVQDRTV